MSAGRMLKLVIIRGSSESSEEWPVPSSATLVQEWRDHDGQVCAFGYAEGRRGWLEWPGLATFSFSEGREEVVAIPSQEAPELAVEEVFRQSASPLILQAFGWEALHASAVVGPAGVVGFCGSSDAGSSTIAYSLSRLGHRQCADGALLLNLRGAVKVECLPFTPRLRPFDRAVTSPIEAADSGSQSSSRAGTNPADRLYALFLLIRTTSSPRVTRLAADEAFPTILKHAYCFNPVDAEARRRLVANYLSLVAQVPVFELGVGTGLRPLEVVAQLILDMVSDEVLVRAAR